jgi:hypothetical protein
LIWFTKDPSATQIAVREYTLDEGRQTGDPNLPTPALDMTPADGTDGVKVAFDITNLGNEPLSATAFKNSAKNKSTGKVGDVQWLDAAKPGAKNTVTVAGKQYTARPVGDMKALAVGEKALLVGKLTGVKAGTMHSDEGTVAAAGTYSGTKVDATDPWNAKLAAPTSPAPPKPPVKAGAVTGTPIDQTSDRSSLLGSAALLFLAAVVAAWVVRRRTRWSGR